MREFRGHKVNEGRLGDITEHRFIPNRYVETREINVAGGRGEEECWNTYQNGITRLTRLD